MGSLPAGRSWDRSKGRAWFIACRRDIYWHPSCGRGSHKLEREKSMLSRNDAGSRLGSLLGTGKVGIVLLAILALSFIFGVFGTIATGNVGVRTTLGVLTPEPVSPGVFMKWPLISSVDEFSAKEISIDLNDLKPKAKDNLS